MKEFERSLAIILDEWETGFTEREARIRYKVAQETAELLRETSPKRYGDYADGWTAKNALSYGSKAGGMAVVYNEAKPRLTHLLEYGHANPTAVRGRKRTPAKPHIAKAETWAQGELIRRLKEEL